MERFSCNRTHSLIGTLQTIIYELLYRCPKTDARISTSVQKDTPKSVADTDQFAIGSALDLRGFSVAPDAFP
jgi:hypothetical protein